MASETEQPKTISMWVADVVIVQRAVQCPTICPHCEADLVSDEGSITVYLDQLDEVTEHAGVSEDEDGELFVEGFETEGSDSVATLNVRCDKCQKSVLAEPGTMRNQLPTGQVVS